MCTMDSNCFPINFSVAESKFENEMNGYTDNIGLDCYHTKERARLEALVRPRGAEQQILALLATSEVSTSAPSPSSLGNFFASQGLSCRIRNALGQPGIDRMLNVLRHTFVEVRSPEPGSNDILLVDPAFREQFSVPKAPQWFNDLLSLIPPILVLSRGSERLESIVRLLADESKIAYAEAGTSVPPWRRPEAQMTKWVPPRSRDLLLTWETNGPMGYASDGEGTAMMEGYGWAMDPSDGQGGQSPDGIGFGTGGAGGRSRRASPTPGGGMGTSASPVPQGLPGLQFVKEDTFSLARSPSFSGVSGASPRSLLKELLGASPQPSGRSSPIYGASPVPGRSPGVSPAPLAPAAAPGLNVTAAVQLSALAGPAQAEAQGQGAEAQGDPTVRGASFVPLPWARIGR